jgi:hypothetical protein
MLIIATSLFGRTEVVNKMSPKIASLVDMEEIEEVAKAKLSDKFSDAQISGEHLLSLHSIENESLMDKIKPILRNVADDIVTPLDPSDPNRGYIYRRIDGETVQIQKSEFWRAMNRALQEAIQGT